MICLAAQLCLLFVAASPVFHSARRRYLEAEESAEFSVSFSQLHNARPSEPDPVPAVQNPKIFLAQSLHTASKSAPGKVRFFPFHSPFRFLIEPCVAVRTDGISRSADSRRAADLFRADGSAAAAVYRLSYAFSLAA